MNVIRSLKQRFGNFIHIKLNEFKELFETNEEITISYKGFKLFCTANNSIVKRFKRDGDYEPAIQQQIISTLQKLNAPVFIDIGANIGMISLGVLNKVPHCSIYAFEPAPHQFSLFQKTIQINQLSDNVTLYNTALSNSNSQAEFIIHDKKHAAGDGFIDTGRAGKVTAAIQVQVKTLDSWWHDHNKTKVDFIKIDTEGAELWVLEGGKECIMQCGPVLLVEIYSKNLKNYPYTELDVINLIYSYGYSCKINNQLIDKETFINSLHSISDEEFLFVKN